MKFIVYPVRLKFNLNPEKHTVATMQRWESSKNVMDLTGNIRAVFAESEEEGLEIIKDECRNWLGALQEETPESFTLIYSSCAIEGCRAWVGSHVVSSTSL